VYLHNWVLLNCIHPINPHLYQLAPHLSHRMLKHDYACFLLQSFPLERGQCATHISILCLPLWHKGIHHTAITCSLWKPRFVHYVLLTLTALATGVLQESRLGTWSCLIIMVSCSSINWCTCW